MTKSTVTQADMEFAATVSGFSSWEDAIYWSNLAKQTAVTDLANKVAAYREAAIKEAVELLENLAARENAYRKVHDLVGVEHWETEKARLLMQYAGDAARLFLTSAKGQDDD